ncbi:MAG: 16S rRNA (cytosine(967)-C(5))-methyltransferase RsmB [Candidatus Marinimicrobia bacterium]|nr:16S rRNA (cytosine(967)-C(5))-methyltransferase RsmB [Candidatus Neomarinimicrobiota bacterium]MCF7904585.1 16S rRNA (cytosine(967)-C(5))-methyltransferase RsmB [Candidatus Neomarinimicrobiota bacterium]
MVSTPRELAFKILLSAEKDSSRYIDDILGDVFTRHNPEQQAKAWIMELVYGITRMRLKIDLIIAHYFKGQYHKSQHAVKVLLRLGVYQLMYMSTAKHAAINETVNLARKVGHHRSAALINAILRKVNSQGGEEMISSKLKGSQQVALQTSHPAWMLERWIENYDFKAVENLCEYNNRTPAVWVRRNVAKVPQAQFEQFLQDNAIEFERSTVIDSFYHLKSAAAIIQSQEFSSGWFSFQDLAAGMVASLVIPESGDSILDACSAPGGKMALIMEKYGSELETMYAFDASSQRLQKVKDTVERLSLIKVEVDQKDASVDSLPGTNWTLLDVPCSGTGVLSRRPDARWKKQPGDIDSLQEIQIKILLNTWKHLQNNGRMIYATCSLEPEENWELIDAVIHRLKNARIEPILDENLQAYVDERGALSTLPWRDNMDGMFAVRLRKLS